MQSKWLAKQATYAREAWRICTRFACTGRGRRPDAPCFVLLFKSRENVPDRERPSGSAVGKAAERRTESRFVKPRNSIARAACCPDRGKLPACQEVPKRERFYVLFASTKRTKSSRRAAALSTPGDGSKLYRLYFFVTFPALVPKPAYGATRFLRCFEPVRKGCCSTDARPIFFENGLLYYKLTGAYVFKKGSCSLSLLR